MTATQPVFFYDLGDPDCYLVAERIMSELGIVPEWEPVLASALGVACGSADRERIGARVVGLGLQPLRWPSSWPPDSTMAMLAATYAKQIGRAVAFSLAAFRQTFAGGRDLGDEGTVLLAAAACEMHPAAVLKAVQTWAVRARLAEAVTRASAAGTDTVPAIQIADELFEGPDCLELARAALAAR